MLFSYQWRKAHRDKQVQIFPERVRFSPWYRAFVAGLEYSTDRTAEVVWKPSKTFFQLAALRFAGDIPHREILMIGDDVRDDVLG